MYGSGGGGLTKVTTAAGAGTSLAMTGFPVVGFTILALVAIIAGLVLLRAAAVRRDRSASGASKGEQ